MKNELLPREAPQYRSGPEQLGGPDLQAGEEHGVVDTGFGHNRLLPDVALADEGVHPSMFGVQDPVFAHAHPQIFLVLIDEIALLPARADDLDDDVRHPFRPDLVVGWLRVEVDGLVRVPVRHRARGLELPSLQRLLAPARTPNPPRIRPR